MFGPAVPPPLHLRGEGHYSEEQDERGIRGCGSGQATGVLPRLGPARAPPVSLLAPCPVGQQLLLRVPEETDITEENLGRACWILVFIMTFSL